METNLMTEIGRESLTISKSSLSVSTLGPPAMTTGTNAPSTTSLKE